MVTLTDKQQAVFDYIASFVDDGKPAPTIREIQLQFGWRSPQSVTCHLKALESRGALVREPHRTRAMRVIRDKTIPFLGKIS